MIKAISVNQKYSQSSGQKKLGNQSAFAQKMKLSETTIYYKLNGKIEFRQSEILNACNILDIPVEEMKDYFFYIQS